MLPITKIYFPWFPSHSKIWHYGLMAPLHELKRQNWMSQWSIAQGKSSLSGLTSVEIFPCCRNCWHLILIWQTRQGMEDKTKGKWKKKQSMGRDLKGMLCALWWVVWLRIILSKLRDPGMSLSPCNLIGEFSPGGWVSQKPLSQECLENWRSSCLKRITA